MAANLPYLASPGTIKSALERIRTAATPERFTADFVHAKLQIKGGAGSAVPPFMKRIGFVKSDGTPSEIYHRFRNAQTSGGAVADAIRIGYKELFEVNEYCYDLNESELLGLICQVTGAAADSSTARLTVSTIRNLKSFADFDAKLSLPDILTTSREEPRQSSSSLQPENGKIGLNLAYTINLNLPATADQAVFNAIFKSLKEHLLNED